jgi:hypothetical protein
VTYLLANALKGHEGATKVAVGLDGEGDTGIAGMDVALVLGHVPASCRAAIAPFCAVAHALLVMVNTDLLLLRYCHGYPLCHRPQTRTMLNHKLLNWTVAPVFFHITIHMDVLWGTNGPAISASPREMTEKSRRPILAMKGLNFATFSICILAMMLLNLLVIL